MFYAKIHNISGDVLLAGCDKDILGSVLVEGDLEVKVNPHFYGGSVVGKQEFLRHMEEATIVNIIGNRIVDLVVTEGLVHEENVKKVGGVKHAQIVSIPKKER
jgi:hypothetical protein